MLKSNSESEQSSQNAQDIIKGATPKEKRQTMKAAIIDMNNQAQRVYINDKIVVRTRTVGEPRKF